MSDQVSFTPERALSSTIAASAGAKARFYETATTTPVTVYADADATTPLSQPVLADAAGVFAQVFYDGPTPVKAVVTAADDTALFTLDPCPLVPTASGSAGATSVVPFTGVPATNVQAALETIQGNISSQTANAQTIVQTGGSANVYTLTAAETISEYAVGQRFVIRANHSNTGAVTLDVDGLGAKSVQRFSGGSVVALVTNDLRTDGIYEVFYDGVRFILLRTPLPAESLGQSGRNLIINGSGRINQRSYTSGAATSAANEFTLDRWFVVTSGQNLTYSGDEAGRVMTAPVGGVSQVIEGRNIVGGTYVLSWTGTATAEINGVPKTNGETVTLTANTNATVTFSGGTFSDVQLEPGTIATPFERVSPGTELALCQRYYASVEAEFRFDGNLGASSVSVGATWFLPGPMRGSAYTPSVVTESSTNASSIVSLSAKGPSGIFAIWAWTNGSTTVARTKAAVLAADAEITS